MITYRKMQRAGFEPLATIEFNKYSATYKAMKALASAEFEIYEKASHGGYQNVNRLETCLEGCLAELAVKQYLETKGENVTPHGLVKRSEEMKKGHTLPESGGDIESNGEHIEVKSVNMNWTPAQIMPRYAEMGKRVMCVVLEPIGLGYKAHIIVDANNVPEWPVMPNNSGTCDCYTMPYIYNLAGK